MTARRPLVINGGPTQQIQAGDIIDPAYLPGGGGVLAGYLSGLTLANNGTSTSVSVATGMATDSTGAYYLSLPSTFYKSLSSAWAAGAGSSGSPVGGLFTGSIAGLTWYHVFLIRKDADGSIDVGFDTSITASHVPAGYTAYRRIATIRTQFASPFNVWPFLQVGDWFYWTTTVQNDIGAGTLAATTMSGFTMTNAPPGVACLLLVYGVFNAGVVGAGLYIGPTARTAAPVQYTAIQPVAGAFAGTGPVLVMSDTFTAINCYASNTLTGTLYLSVQGYQDFRGK